MNRDLVSKCLSMVIGQDQCSDAYEVACFALGKAMSTTHIEQLGHLVKNGPLWDGDVISKSARNDLIEWGLAGRALVKGQEGYTVANYRGNNVYRAMLPPAPSRRDGAPAAKTGDDPATS